MSHFDCYLYFLMISDSKCVFHCLLAIYTILWKIFEQYFYFILLTNVETEFSVYSVDINISDIWHQISSLIPWISFSLICVLVKFHLYFFLPFGIFPREPLPSPRSPDALLLLKFYSYADSILFQSIFNMVSSKGLCSFTFEKASFPNICWRSCPFPLTYKIHLILSTGFVSNSFFVFPLVFTLLIASTVFNHCRLYAPN